ncbi:hypothetical protein EJF36_05240 [Bacillus sp. HMF5848]|uniref:YhzD family protein n=1 Tax=Bacillus sp. HMF5848 TaxID=2495421 RepID=UPI000F772826|nr:YhzD family protein [Bacillus sp. HMF5848]RSK26311.1 hypothetical protein EJF36_05240 [Bacillus sp. HMF5848]
MATYFITVYAKDGEKLLDEAFEATSDRDAKQVGEDLLKEKQYDQHTHRCISSSGALILFHR